MNIISRLAMLVAIGLFFFLPFGCGGCDETGGTTIDPPDVMGGDVSDAGDLDATDVDSGPGSDVSDDTDSPDTDDGEGEPCDLAEGDTRPCGSDVGECLPGAQYCLGGFWSECYGGIGGHDEQCNGRDDSCSGTADDDPTLCPDSLCHGTAVCEGGDCVYDPSTALDCSHLDTPCMIGVCAEKEGECIQVPKTDNSPCNDGNLCTADEGVCMAGECIADAKDCSGADDQCNEGICDPATGQCNPSPLSDGISCNDGRFCTVSSTCSNGQCVGQARDCSSVGDQCNEGICNEAQGCMAVPKASGTTCDNGLYCTVNDTCEQGTCVAGGPRNCSAEGGSCRDGVCDEDTRSCTGDPVPDGTVCDDGLFCTVQTTCAAGECTNVVTTRDCSASGDDICTEGVCNESSDRCEAAPFADSTPCDDGRSCTTNTACQGGACLGTPVNCSGLADQCNSGRCSESQGGCIAEPRPNDTICNDGLNCTVNTTCNDGVCEGPARSCAYLNEECTFGTCEESAGGCTSADRPTGTECDDGVFCTVDTTCTGGDCGGGDDRDCSAATDTCNVGFCDEANGRCSTVPVDCSGMADQCNDGVCSPMAGGCVKAPRTGTSCNDELFCTVNDTCQAGVCQGSPRDCSAEGGSCLSGTCDESSQSCTGEHLPDGTNCDDGLFCTVQTTCTAGACTNVVTERDCSAAGDGICTEGTCNESDDQCEPIPVANNTACDDGQACTEGTTCQAGVCVGTAVSCDDLVDQCNTAICDEPGGCRAVPVTAGTPCDDGLHCTVNDACNAAGVCQGGQARDCSGLSTGCETGICDEETNSCTTQDLPDGTTCNDGVFCNAETTCEAGQCTNLVTARDCSSLNGECQTGVCDIDQDRCIAIQDDLTCMTVIITAHPEARTWSSEAIFEFECSEPPCAYYECRVNGGNWEPCDSPQEYTGLAVGEHTFQVRASKDGVNWTDPAQYDWEVYLPTCADAAASRLYIGCEYWPVALANTVSSTFHNHFALVVTNPLPGTTANIAVYGAGSTTPVAQVQVPGNELRVVRLPWNAMPATVGRVGGGSISRTRKGTIAYRMESDIPVNAYQFNPLLSHALRACVNNGQCPSGDRCTGGFCENFKEYSHSNDASLLLPAHIFGQNSQYVVPSLPHMRLFWDGDTFDPPSIVAIVATEDATEVRIRARGYTAPGDFAEIDPGADVTVTLNRHEVLQLASRAAGAYNQVPAVNSGTAREYYESDLTGSIINSNKPIAVYSGAECRFVPFNYWACDHIEQQIFPLETLGFSYVGAVATPPQGVDLQTVLVSGDVWRLVAVQNGTQISFNPGTVHANVTLDAGEWIEFVTDEHFHVESQGADYPILLTQYLTGQNAHGGAYGDPSMILPAPVGQYRQQSMFTTPEEIATHYVNIVRRTGTSVNLDGTPVPESCWESVGTTNFEVCRTQISEGIHTISAGSGVGLTVYGYDSYVSYGYTGGLGLLPTTAVNPDW
ncbi:MAG: hypothetical protein ACNA8W_07945 [Bradymonadaceae bacterium]